MPPRSLAANRDVLLHSQLARLAPRCGRQWSLRRCCRTGVFGWARDTILQVVVLEHGVEAWLQAGEEAEFGVVG
jgi:hypothetical protein